MENYSNLLNLLSGMESSHTEGGSGLSSVFGGNRKLLIWVILFLIFYSCYCNRGYGYGYNNFCCDYDHDDCCCGKHKKHKCKDCCCIEIDPYCLCNGGYNNYGRGLLGGYGNGCGTGLLGGCGNGCGINICTIAILAAIFLIRKGC